MPNTTGEISNSKQESNTHPLTRSKVLKVREDCLSNTLAINASSSPCPSKSPFRLLEIVDSRLERNTEKMQNMLRDLFCESETRLLSQIDKRISEMKQDINNITERVAKLEAKTNEILEDKLLEINAAIINVVERVKGIETNLDNSNGVSNSADLQTEVAKLRLKVLQHSNAAVASELRINNIPYFPNENLHDLFNFFCEVINVPTPNITCIYRVKSKNNNLPAPTILVKLSCPYEKNYILKSVAVFRRNRRDLLRLNILNFDSDVPFYVNENLSKANYEIFNAATKLKKQKIIYTAFTLRGTVYVKKTEHDQPKLIEQIEDLTLFRGNNDAL